MLRPVVVLACCCSGVLSLRAGLGGLASATSESTGRTCTEGMGAFPCWPRVRGLTDGYLKARQSNNEDDLMEMVTPETRWLINADAANLQVQEKIIQRTGTELEGPDKLKMLFAATSPGKVFVRSNKGVEEYADRPKTKNLWCKLNMCSWIYEENFGLMSGPTSNLVEMYWYPEGDKNHNKIRAVFQTVTSHARGKALNIQMYHRPARPYDKKDAKYNKYYKQEAKSRQTANVLRGVQEGWIQKLSSDIKHPTLEAEEMVAEAGLPSEVADMAVAESNVMDAVATSNAAAQEADEAANDISGGETDVPNWPR